MQLIYPFVFVYAEIQFSHDVAYMLIIKKDLPCQANGILKLSCQFLRFLKAKSYRFDLNVFRARYPASSAKENYLSRMEHMFRRSPVRGAGRPNGCHGEAEPVPGGRDG